MTCPTVLRERFPSPRACLQGFPRVLLTLLLPVLTLLTLFGLTPTAHAQTAPRLFEILPEQTLVDTSGASSEALAMIRARPTTASVTLVRINAAALDGPILSLNFSNTQSVDLRHARSDILGRSTVVWSGTMAQVPGEATLVIQNGNITGSVNHNGDIYRIESVGNGVHALVKLDTGRLPPEHPPSFNSVERAAPASSAAPAPKRPRGKQGMAPADAFPGDGRPVVIDVLVGYTPAASSAVTNISQTIALAVAEANQSYVNSGIRIRLNLVDTMSISYTEADKSFETILADAVANTDLRNRRTSSGADLVAVIINKTDYCGLATAIKANADSAYAIVHFDCATGYYSFAHELGHLMGARHDPANDPTKTPYAYGHGFQFVSGTTKWRTIVAYNCAVAGGCPRLQYWSNPDVSYGGVAMGTAATSNNARVLNETATTMASFKSLAVQCNVFNDGYAAASGPTDAIYFRANGSLCRPDGTASGACRKWFGQCGTATGDKASFTVFDNGYANASPPKDAVYVPQAQKACIPDGTPSGSCRRWVGRALTQSGKPVSCYLFNDGYTSAIGPTDAVYARGPNQVCMPDGTATGACRRWFGRCVAR